ncbi:hypothetical protein UPYG_G00022950 [Umbra pygmaea]|uniref:Ig-like domain-containing protein n=1 Tax=Umbra pygmaea TaxID=75934 RepID=A0ABD0XL65_UMBPY
MPASARTQCQNVADGFHTQWNFPNRTGHISNTMSWTFQLTVLVLQGFVTLLKASPETCDTYNLFGSSTTVPLSYKASRNDEIIWKHNGSVIFKRKNQKYLPGNKDDLSTDGSLKLNSLKFSDGGTYNGEVFRDGKSLRTTTFRVCVQEKISKPKGSFNCSPLNVIMTCNVTSTNTVSFSWKKNGNVQIGKTETVTILLKDLKDSDTFTCSVANEVSNKTSDIIKPTCKGNVSKPTVTLACSPKEVTFTCNITDTDMKSFNWMKNGKLLDEKTETTLTILLKDLKESDTFTCSVANEVSNETSDSIKPTCKADPNPAVPHLLFGFDFWTMVGILAGGAGLVLIIIISMVHCYRRQKRSEEGEFRQVPPTESFREASTHTQG